MTTFTLGAGVRCDLATLVDTRLLIQASSGGGKSWALRRILEQTSGKVQQLVIDPEGEFHTLRERYDYVYAAPHSGDTVAHPRSAALLAERLLELGASAILDIFELKPPQRREFVRRFLEALVEVPKRLYHPVIVVLDEAHDYAPEGQQCESTAAVIDEASRGRKRGQCLILATQRISKLSKDAAAELKNRMIGGTFLDVDMKRAGDELGTDQEGRRQLRELAPGEFWAFGPALTRAPTRVMVGAVETTHPKPGAKLDAPVPPTPERIRALLPKLADLPAEAEQRQRTTDELKRDLAEARRRVTTLERGAPARVETKVETHRVEVPVLTGTQLQAFERGTARLEKVGAQLVEVGGQVVTVARELVEAAKRAAGGNGKPDIKKYPLRPSHVAPARPQAKHEAASRFTPAEGVGRSAQRILNGLAWLESIGLERADKTQVALLADQSPTSGGYFNNLGKLRTAGLIDYPAPSVVQLTDAGRAAAEPVDVPTSSEDLHQQLFARLPGAQARILEHLIAEYPAAGGKDALAAATAQSPTSGGYFNNLGRLRSLGLIGYPAPGQAVALPVLFLEAR